MKVIILIIGLLSFLCTIPVSEFDIDGVYSKKGKHGLEVIELAR